eukprot:COSAG02_NODE_2736_length_8130_cov_4.458722_4_plen_105_part_00
MGFPEWFRVDLDFGVASGGGASQKHAAIDGNRFYAQIGNAVCPPVVTALAEPLLKEMRIVGEPSDCPETMEVDCHNSKRKREVERHACDTRPTCACAKIFVLEQ